VRDSLATPYFSVTLNGISSALTPSSETIGVGSAVWPAPIVRVSGSTAKFPMSETKSTIVTVIGFGLRFVRIRWSVTGGSGLPSSCLLSPSA